MRTGLSFDFTGLLNKLSEIERKASQEIVDNALNKGAEVILQEQKKTVPKDTLELHDSLDVGKKGGTGINRRIKIGIISASKEVSAYGYYQEYGTFKIIGQKWMKRAWINKKDEAKKAIIESIKNDLKE